MTEMPLSEMYAGQTGTVIEIRAGERLRDQLSTMGIREGKKLKVIATQPAGGPVVMRIDNLTFTIGRGKAKKIIIKP